MNRKTRNENIVSNIAISNSIKIPRVRNLPQGSSGNIVYNNQLQKYFVNVNKEWISLEDSRNSISNIRYVSKRADIPIEQANGSQSLPYPHIQDAIDDFGLPQNVEDFEQFCIIIVLDSENYDNKPIEFYTRRYNLYFYARSKVGQLSVNIDDSLKYGTGFFPSLSIITKGTNQLTMNQGIRYTSSNTTIGISLNIVNAFINGQINIPDTVANKAVVKFENVNYNLFNDTEIIMPTAELNAINTLFATEGATLTVGALQNLDTVSFALAQINILDQTTFQHSYINIRNIPSVNWNFNTSPTIACDLATIKDFANNVNLIGSTITFVNKLPALTSVNTDAPTSSDAAIIENLRTRVNELEQRLKILEIIE